jgi:hypothetical protein
MLYALLLDFAYFTNHANARQAENGSTAQNATLSRRIIRSYKAWKWCVYFSYSADLAFFVWKRWSYSPAITSWDNEASTTRKWGTINANKLCVLDIHLQKMQKSIPEKR